MPINLTISDFKQFSEIRNGKAFDIATGEFVRNAVANVMESVQVSFKATFNYFSNASTSNIWTVENGRITRSDGKKWNVEDSIVIDDEFLFFSSKANAEFTGQVTGFADNGTTLLFTVIAGNQKSSGESSEFSIIFDPNNPANNHGALFHRFGLVDNDDEYNNNSLVTGESQSYSVIGMSGVQAPIDAEIEGKSKAWVTGSAKASIVSVDTAKYTVTYEVIHNFIVNPSYITGQLSNLQNNQAPELFAGDNSLKYVFELELRKGKNSLSTSKKAIFDSTDGSIGWFNENFNGGQSKYLISNIAYSDTVTAEVKTALQATARTTATFIISKDGASFAGGEPIVIYVQYLPENEAEYIDTVTDYKANFLYDSIRVIEGSGAVSGTGIIKSATASIVGDDISVSVQIEYTEAQGVFIFGKDVANYILSCSIENPALPAIDSDRVMLIADVNQYFIDKDLTGIISFDTFTFYVYDRVVNIDSPATTLQAWDSDFFVSQVEFTLDLSKSAFLSFLNFCFVAYNTVDDSYFKLDNFSFNTDGSIISGGVQRIYQELTRGYNLENGSQFNIAKIETLSRVGDLQKYRLTIGQQVPYQSWLFNNNADRVFYDDSKPQNNLNFLASNYAQGINDYQARVLIEASVAGVNDSGVSVSGITTGSSNNIELYDYSKDGNNPPEWTLDIKTLDSETLEDLEGRILFDKDTIFQCEWTFKNILTTSAVIFCWHGISQTEANGYDYSVISNLYKKPNDVLKPIEGANFLTIDLALGKIVSRCLIDYTKLTGSKYDLTARLQR